MGLWVGVGFDSAYSILSTFIHRLQHLFAWWASSTLVRVLWRLGYVPRYIPHISLRTPQLKLYWTLSKIGIVGGISYMFTGTITHSGHNIELGYVIAFALWWGRQVVPHPIGNAGFSPSNYFSFLSCLCHSFRWFRLLGYAPSSNFLTMSKALRIITLALREVTRIVNALRGWGGKLVLTK